MHKASKFFVQKVGERWAFGREGTLFEAFPTLELAIERAKQFAKLHEDVEVVVIDESGKERAA